MVLLLLLLLPPSTDSSPSQATPQSIHTPSMTGPATVMHPSALLRRRPSCPLQIQPSGRNNLWCSPLVKSIHSPSTPRRLAELQSLQRPLYQQSKGPHPRPSCDKVFHCPTSLERRLAAVSAPWDQATWLWLKSKRECTKKGGWTDGPSRDPTGAVVETQPKQ